jgi:hypothetical protein
MGQLNATPQHLNISAHPEISAVHTNPLNTMSANPCGQQELQSIGEMQVQADFPQQPIIQKHSASSFEGFEQLQLQQAQQPLQAQFAEYNISQANQQVVQPPQPVNNVMSIGDYI